MASQSILLKTETPEGSLSRGRRTLIAFLIALNVALGALVATEIVLTVQSVGATTPAQVAPAGPEQSLRSGDEGPY